MNTTKTYSLKKTFLIASAAALGFTLLALLLSPLLQRFWATLLPDQGAAWYFWKLPHPELIAGIAVWTLYAAHQVLVWLLIYRLQKQPAPQPGRVNGTQMALMLVNLLFIALHQAQTLLLYDGLAQYVPVMSSQGSVIVMLVMILILLNRRRGLFFGKRARLPERGVAAVRSVHGYYIAWAVVYTFWFHPVEGTLGHLLGFFYLYMLLVQISLAKTSLHTDIRWVTGLEVFVALHGAVVAIVAGNGMWPMFFFGFLMMFLVTQMHGVLRSKAARAGVIAGYAALALLAYGGVFRNWFTGTPVTFSLLHQVLWIPVILYGLVYVLAWGAQGVTALRRKAE